MIIPCIDLQRGRAVQLERGRRCRLTVKDSMSLIDRFQAYGVLHVIDLDAAMRRGGNSRLVRALCREAARRKIRVRVGGGICSVARAERVLGWGAEKIIVGSAAFRRGRVHRKFLHRLIARVGRKRVILALDSEGGRIVVRGWQKKLSLRPQDVMPALQKYCSEFLCTYVDAEGMMRGTNLKWFRSLRRATSLPITAAGGIRNTREITALERLKMNAAVGMALYRGRLGSPPRRRRPHRSSAR
jgi:phosphoribosylformimino-5-aminoimidazole carboxamide ribonucleotide (ProFAR) isomerase